MSEDCFLWGMTKEDVEELMSEIPGLFEGCTIEEHVIESEWSIMERK